jgi:thiamine-phosphate pyrophosphorylase
MTRDDVPALYAIADRDALGATGLPTAVRILTEEGVRWIQIRAKGMPGEELRREVEACLEVTLGSETRLWLNDRVDLALLAPVAGVHLGQADLPAAAARSLLGTSRWLGRSTHDPVQVARAANDDAVDLIAVGPVFPTRGKQDPGPVVGTELLSFARRLTDKPVVAIGGMTAKTLGEALDAGADAVAVLGAVCRGNVRENARRLLAAAGGRR